MEPLLSFIESAAMEYCYCQQDKNQEYQGKDEQLSPGVFRYNRIHQLVVQSVNKRLVYIGDSDDLFPLVVL